jgi:hypothetical protein
MQRDCCRFPPFHILSAMSFLLPTMMATITSYVLSSPCAKNTAIGVRVCVCVYMCVCVCVCLLVCLCVCVFVLLIILYIIHHTSYIIHEGVYYTQAGHWEIVRLLSLSKQCAAPINVASGRGVMCDV